VVKPCIVTCPFRIPCCRSGRLSSPVSKFSFHAFSSFILISPGDWTGDVARLVAKYRPSMPVLTLLSPEKHGARVSRQLSLHRGVFPTLLSYDEALPAAVAQGLLTGNDQMVVVAADKGLTMSVVDFKSK